MLPVECERSSIEGVVSKLKDASYRSGKRLDQKVTQSWREADKHRADLFSQGVLALLIAAWIVAYAFIALRAWLW